MPEEFPAIAERIVDALLAASPAMASFAGDHRFDHQLPDLSEDGVARDAAMLRDASDALAQVDDLALDEAERVDHAVLTALVDRSLFELTEVREQEWNPLVHNPGELLYPLLTRASRPADERLASLAGRLSQIPDALATARATLSGCPRIHLETAAGQFGGTAELITGELAGLIAQAPAAGPRAIAAADQAVAALGEFQDWLRERLAEPGEGRDPRLGRKLWEARLWHTLDTELTAAQVLEQAQANLERVTGELRAAAAELIGGPADDATVRRALDQLGDEHPTNETIVGLAQGTFTEATEFVRAHQLATLIDDPCVIQEMPEFARGVAVAYCDPPGPLESTALPTFYCISPTPADWSAERVDSFYREYNNHMLRNLTVHEAMPGHFLQLAHSRRYRGSTRVRALGFSGPMVEGWAVYAEEMMVEAGFGGLPIRLQQLKMQLRMSLNAILDQLVHCAGLTEEEAMTMMRDRGFQEEGEAAGKWRRALLTSTQLSTYFVGYLEMSALGRARPAGVSALEWHDRMLSYGSPPPRHIRSLLGL